MLHYIIFQKLMTFKNQQQLLNFKLVFLLYIELVSLQKRCSNFDLFYLTRIAKFRSQLCIPIDIQLYRT